MTLNANFNALLNGTKQARIQEKGLPYFRVIENPKPVLVEKPVQPTYKDSLGDKVMNWIVIGILGTLGMSIVGLLIRCMIAWVKP